MKKVLISILLVLLVYFTYYTVANGIHIGKIEALSIEGLKEENSNIDNKINQASKLTSTDYPKKISDLNGSVKELIRAKEDYTDLTTYSSESQIQEANKLEEYEVEVLWTKVGQHATKEGVKMKMDVTTAVDTPTSVDGRKMYDLTFTANGSYIGIALFISALENDSSLEFKIENFKMIPATDNGLQATFTVKNVPIRLNNISSNAPTTNNTQNQTNKENATSTNTTNTTTTTNTTNTTKTTTGS